MASDEGSLSDKHHSHRPKAQNGSLVDEGSQMSFFQVEYAAALTVVLPATTDFMNMRS